jgi:hypothetical protein
MGFLDEMSGILRQATSGNASESEVHAAYDQVSKAVPSGALAEGLSHAFKSEQTPPFEQMVSGLFANSNADQKAGMLNQLLASLGSGGVTQALAGAGGGLGALTAALGSGNLSPQQAQQIPPEAVTALAQQAAKKDPSIMDKAAGFYAEHPTLVKAIGVGALALLMSRISAARR